MSKKTCPKCRGAGNIIQPCGGKLTCPKCHGRGEVEGPVEITRDQK